MGAKGARRSINTKGALRKILSTLHPNTSLEPNPDSNAHRNPQPSRGPTPNPTPTPTPTPNSSPSSNHRVGSELVLGSKLESNDVEKAARNKIWGILFSQINMAGMAQPASYKGEG